MLREVTLPGSVSGVLESFRPCFTAPSFETFTAMLVGLWSQPVGRTVCGMLTGVGLARVWHHARAHRFFSSARWCPREVGLLLAGLVVTHLVAPGAPITVAIDDTGVPSPRAQGPRGGVVPRRLRRRVGQAGVRPTTG